MLKNYFKIAWRNLWKNKTSTFINIVGLSTGLICFILIFLFVQNEFNYDRMHKDPRQVYRVVKDFVNDDGSRIPDATTPPALAPMLQKDIPEVAQVTRLFPSWGRRYVLETNNKKFNEQDLMRVDSNFFTVFTFPIIKGDKNTPLHKPRTIVLTETSSKKYFGDADPIGKSIKLDLDGGVNYEVTAVVKDVPQTSHFKFDFLIPLKFSGGDINGEWGWYNFYTYVRLKENADAASFQKKLQPLFKKYQPDNTNEFYAQSLSNIHLDSRLKWELGTNGDRSYVNIMLAVAIFVLVIAAINYVNLATARSAKRAKEVGIRKVTGANKSLLVGQFLGESVLTVFLSLILSIIVTVLLLSFYNQLMDKQLTLFGIESAKTWYIIIGVTILVGFAAGLYPAFYLAKFQPMQVLKSQIANVAKGRFLRKGLVTFQFVISIVMITSIIIISQQMSFITNKKLGYDKNNIMLLHNVGRLPNKMALREEFKKIPAVKEIGGADGMLGGQNWTNSVRTKERREETLLNFLTIDFEFLPAMNVQMLEGRNFSKDFPTDSLGIILSETAVKDLAIQGSAIGKQIAWGGEDSAIVWATVVGVVKDFHFSSFHEPIKPFGFVLDNASNSRINTFFVKIDKTDPDQTLAQIQTTWKQLVADQPIEYSYQDEQVNKLHRAETKFRSLFSYLTIVAIVIACLGLFGLSVFTAEQRTKEIGIRKVLGASVNGLIQLLSKDFLKLVFLAIIIGSPIAWFFMNQWLQDFVYRINISWLVFLYAGISAMLIALMTVSFQAIKTAISNPVKSLRTE